MAEEYIVGEVSSENNYNPGAETPTIFDFWNATENAGFQDNDLIAVQAFGKTHYGQREFAAPIGIIQKKDILELLHEQAGGDRAKSAIMWIDPDYTGPFLKDLLFMGSNPTHITGIGFKATK